MQCWTPSLLNFDYFYQIMGQSTSTNQRILGFLQQEDQESVKRELDVFLLTPISVELFQHSLHPSDIRVVLQTNPNVIAWTLFYLHSLITEMDLRPNSQYRELKNALMLITLIVPVLYEAPNREFALNVLWHRRIAKHNEEPTDKDAPLLLSLTERLLTLCFFAGFTINGSADVSVYNQDSFMLSLKKYFKEAYKHDLALNLVWKGFQTQCNYPNNDQAYFENRYLVVSALLAIISQNLYNKEFYKLVNGKMSQHPNAILLSFNFLKFFPELLVSLMATALFPTERLAQVLTCVFQFQNLEEKQLALASIQLLKLVIAGQSLVVSQAIQEEDQVEVKICQQHFDYYKCKYPNLLTLPPDIRERIILQACDKLYQLYKSQQSFIRTNMQIHLYDFESYFIYLSYLMLNTRVAAPHIMTVFLFSILHEVPHVSEISKFMLLYLSQFSPISLQLSQPIEFLLTFRNFPVIKGNYIDLYVVTMCDDILSDKLNELQILNLAITFYNVASDCGPLNAVSTSKLLYLLGKMCTYDFILRSTVCLQVVQHLVNAIHVILFKNPNDSMEMVALLIAQTRIFEFMARPNKVSAEKLQKWWQKHKKDPLIDKSFIQGRKSQPSIDGRREQSLMPETWQGTQQNPRIQEDKESINFNQQNEQENDVGNQREQSLAGEVNGKQEVLGSQMIEGEDYTQINSPRVQQNQYFESWKLLREKEQMNLAPQTLKFLHEVLELRKKQESLKEVYNQHNLIAFFENIQLPKIFINPFDGYKIITKQIWADYLRLINNFPTFESSELCTQLKKAED